MTSCYPTLFSEDIFAAKLCINTATLCNICQVDLRAAKPSIYKLCYKARTYTLRDYSLHQAAKHVSTFKDKALNIAKSYTLQHAKKQTLTYLRSKSCTTIRLCKLKVVKLQSVKSTKGNNQHYLQITS